MCYVWLDKALVIQVVDDTSYSVDKFNDQDGNAFAIGLRCVCFSYN